jgi:hypothetical protein
VAEDLSNHIVVVCENTGDAVVARGFGQRVLMEHIEWLRDLSDTPEALPTWGGLTAVITFTGWGSVGRLYKDTDLPIVRNRDMNGQPPEPDAITALKAFRLAEQVTPLAVVLLRDIDSVDARRNGLAQARAEYEQTSHAPITCVIGLPSRYQEAWLLAGFQPRNDRESAELQRIHDEIQNFHPTREPENLRGRDGETRHAKTIWERLSNNDEARAEMCWTVTPLEHLHQHGAGCGLSAYLEEIRVRLVPLLTVVRQSA